MRFMLGVFTVLLCLGCATPQVDAPAVEARGAFPTLGTVAKFERDREAILAMAGDYRVTFDFTETVSFVDGYDLKDPKRSGATEVVRVIEDSGDYISLQHILVVGGDEKFPIKHWRQDWLYEPKRVLKFVGGNAWEMHDVPTHTAKGAWSQTVYQVDDSPRYGAVAQWTFHNGIAEWTPPAEIRPLPRRDMTTRDDYDAVLAVNRHALTPGGWVHEQDNSKLILRDGDPQILSREVGVNTYVRYSDFDVSVAEEYWEKTESYWRAVKAEWARYENEYGSFGLTMQGEPASLYMPLLELAGDVGAGEKDVSVAVGEAAAVIKKYTTIEIGSLTDRLSVAVSGSN